MARKAMSPSAVTADHEKGREATDLFRAAYNRAGFNTERARVLNENIAFRRGLDKLLAECSVPFAPPKGGSIHILSVLVNPARDWNEAVSAAGPDTGVDEYVRKVGDQYPPQKGKTEERESILVNFGRTIPNGQYALDWAKPISLRPSTSRGVFAIGEHHPNLHTELGVNTMEIVSLHHCLFGGGRRVPRVWLGAAKWIADLPWFDGGWGADCWFPFSRKLAA